MRPRILSLLILVLAAPSGLAATPRGRIVVIVEGVRNHQGTIRASLFNHPDGFPGDSSLAAKRAITPARTAPLTLVFTGVPPGEYAVAVLHDENDDWKMRSNWLGMPREGYGTSNNPGGRPKYAKSRFRMEGSKTILTIHLVYR